MIVFSPALRLALGLIVGLLGYLVAGELPISRELAGAIAGLTTLLGSVGIVPPKAENLPHLSPQIRLALTGAATAGTYVITTLSVDTTVRGIIVAALALAASVGIVPPTAQRR